MFHLQAVGLRVAKTLVTTLFPLVLVGIYEEGGEGELGVWQKGGYDVSRYTVRRNPKLALMPWVVVR